MTSHDFYKNCSSVVPVLHTRQALVLFFAVLLTGVRDLLKALQGEKGQTADFFVVENRIVWYSSVSG
jgi:hypothetical protein